MAYPKIQANKEYSFRPKPNENLCTLSFTAITKHRYKNWKPKTQVSGVIPPATLSLTYRLPFSAAGYLITL